MQLTEVLKVRKGRLSNFDTKMRKPTVTCVPINGRMKLMLLRTMQTSFDTFQVIPVQHDELNQIIGFRCKINKI